MRQYLDVLEKILETGVHRGGRNGGTVAIFAEQMRFNMKDGFPAVTTKKLAWKVMASELLWFISGSSNINDLKAIYEKNRIWDLNFEDYLKRRGMELHESNGYMGRVYGAQWRRYQSFKYVPGHPGNSEWEPGEYKMVEIDQLQEAIDRIKHDPYSRRIIVNAWNPGEVNPHDVALPPCHMFFQFFVTPEAGDVEEKPKYLSLSMYQRSCDMFLGVPFNIASYALLLHMVSHVTGLTAKELVITLGDAHIYDDHVGVVYKQLAREPLPLPQLWIDPNRNIKEIDDFTIEDVKLRNYRYHNPIEADMSV